MNEKIATERGDMKILIIVLCVLNMIVCFAGVHYSIKRKEIYSLLLLIIIMFFTLLMFYLEVQP